MTFYMRDLKFILADQYLEEGTHPQIPTIYDILYEGLGFILAGQCL